jgi:hypothetical protein
MVVAWVEKWRERVVRTENLDRSMTRAKGAARIEELKRKQLKLSQKIQWHEEEYDRAVTAASLRRAPTQNGSDRRKYLAFAHAEHTSELALRPSDRQVSPCRRRLSPRMPSRLQAAAL